MKKKRWVNDQSILVIFETSCQILLTPQLSIIFLSRKCILSQGNGKMGNYGEIIETFYTDDPSDPTLNRMFMERYELEERNRFEYITEQEEKKNKCPYFFLTINPNPQIALSEFISIMNKMMTKPWIENYLYVYAQRGEDEGECGKGFHFHTIIKKPPNKSYAHILRELSSSANKVCDSSVCHFCKLKNISEEEKERKIIYLTGRKTDQVKHLK